MMCQIIEDANTHTHVYLMHKINSPKVQKNMTIVLQFARSIQTRNNHFFFFSCSSLCSNDHWWLLNISNTHTKTWHSRLHSLFFDEWSLVDKPWANRTHMKNKKKNASGVRFEERERDFIRIASSQAVCVCAGARSHPTWCATNDRIILSFVLSMGMLKSRRKIEFFCPFLLILCCHHLDERDGEKRWVDTFEQLIGRVDSLSPLCLEQLSPFFTLSLDFVFGEIFYKFNWKCLFVCNRRRWRWIDFDYLLINS